jgi:Alw26I/Eco31I/Esp3I family type II restriction endonuclease
MSKLQPSEVFLQYEEEMASNSAYAGMPDLYEDNGDIQWEAPSNRSGGKFRDTHDKRLAWWKHKAAEIGISTNEDKWISKVAKQIHPTKRKPCKVCGKVMDIRYCYLNSQFMRAVRKIPYITDDLEMDECTHIVDFVTEFVGLYGLKALDDLRGVLKCKAVSKVPHFDSLDGCISWLWSDYIPKEPSRLSPGAMSNAPDRLDGFHTYNRCCRHKADKGRSKTNLASYSTDRRAFEYWVDGNWVTANKTMGLFKTDPMIKQLDCLNKSTPGNHPKPCDADHIGPISLGFCHRPSFQPLCSSCNSAKNNRMYMSDVRKLIRAEAHGEQVITWYAKSVWDKCKSLVHSNEDAVKLSRILRDNRHNAMMLYGVLLNAESYVFLSTFLNLNYADYSYDNPKVKVDGSSTVTVSFESHPTNLRYSTVQKARRLRVAFQALQSYCDKENRNGFDVTFEGQRELAKEIVASSKLFEDHYAAVHQSLALESSAGFNDEEVIKHIVQDLPSVDEFQSNAAFTQTRTLMTSYMDKVGTQLAAHWNDLRYIRDEYSL